MITGVRRMRRIVPAAIRRAERSPPSAMFGVATGEPDATAQQRPQRRRRSFTAGMRPGAMLSSRTPESRPAAPQPRGRPRAPRRRRPSGRGARPPRRRRRSAASTGSWAASSSGASAGFPRSAAIVYCDRSLVPIEKKSRWGASRSACSAAAGTSIIAPTSISVGPRSSRAASTSSTVETIGNMTETGCCCRHAQDGAELGREQLRVREREAQSADAEERVVLGLGGDERQWLVRAGVERADDQRAGPGAWSRSRSAPRPARPRWAARCGRGRGTRSGAARRPRRRWRPPGRRRRRCRCWRTPRCAGRITVTGSDGALQRAGAFLGGRLPPRLERGGVVGLDRRPRRLRRRRRASRPPRPRAAPGRARRHTGSRAPRRRSPRGRASRRARRRCPTRRSGSRLATAPGVSRSATTMPGLGRRPSRRGAGDRRHDALRDVADVDRARAEVIVVDPLERLGCRLARAQVGDRRRLAVSRSRRAPARRCSRRPAAAPARRRSRPRPFGSSAAVCCELRPRDADRLVEPRGLLLGRARPRSRQGRRSGALTHRAGPSARPSTAVTPRSVAPGERTRGGRRRVAGRSGAGRGGGRAAAARRRARRPSSPPRAARGPRGGRSPAGRSRRRRARRPAPRAAARCRSGCGRRSGRCRGRGCGIRQSRRGRRRAR